MRIGALIAAAIALITVAVLFVAETGRSTAETNVAKQRIATELREAILTQELALDQAIAGLGLNRLAKVATARGDLERAIERARARIGDHADETPLVEGQAQAYREYRRGAEQAIAAITAERAAGKTATSHGTATERLAAFERFLAINDDYRADLDNDRRADAGRASLITVVTIAGLSTLFLLVGMLLMHRERRGRAALAASEKSEREAEERFLKSQRRLGEALQVAADQREAHGLIKSHLEQSMAGTQVHVLNRNNSADRLESSTSIPEESSLAAPLKGAQPRSCVAVRLSREYERGPGAEEVLACEICGKLDGDSVCRPLLVGGEVIGSVLVESPGPLESTDRRRIEGSVNAAAPVLANLRNLAIAEIRAATDSLTGLPNRRAVDDTVKRMIAQASRAVTPLAVLQLDLDHFKQINDRFGHERGDAALATFGALLRSQLRASDFAGRSGGEEFVVLLPDTDRPGAFQLAEKLRRATAIMQVDGIDHNITTSIGLAVYPDDAAEEASLMRRADRALYAAKQNGRDRVEMVSTASLGEAEPLTA